MARPGATAEVAAVVTACAQHRIVIRGAGTGLANAINGNPGKVIT